MQNVTNKFFYPLTADAVHKFASDIFSPITRGECVTTVWVPMAGRRMWSKFIIENIALFSKELPNFEKYIFVYIEPLDLTEESATGYLRLMGKSFLAVCSGTKKCEEIAGNIDSSVFDNESASYSKLLDTLKTLLKKAAGAGFEVVFFLGEFDELHKFANTVFYNNLKSLWDALKPRLHYVFLTVEDLSSPEMTERFGELNAATLENVVYAQLPVGKDVDYLLDFFSENVKHKFTLEQREVVRELCGGHPYLIKVAARVIFAMDGETVPVDRLREVLSDHYELLSVARRLYNLRSKNEKQVLAEVLEEKSVSFPLELSRLLKLGVVKKTAENKPVLFCQLLSKAVAQAQKPAEAVIREGAKGANLHLGEDGQIMLNGGLLVDEKFTRQEYEVVRLFLKEPGKICSRDEVSETLWGKDSYEKYSDWAIDQIMSKIRKKMKELGTQTVLMTLRGRGYRLQ